jgi:6-pyruvoyltetrahydropterin/6-carboxytetrahydropterin synthase
MFTVSKTFSLCYGHRLLHDSGRCRHLHGHSGRATFVLASDGVDERGMVVHFDKLKETVGAWIYENLDHALLLCREDPIVPALASLGERFFAMDENPTAENIARMLFGVAKGFGLPVASVAVWESETAAATYAERAG